MKTSICADLHLNNSNFGRMDKSGLSFRTRDFMAAFDWCVDHSLSVVKPGRFVVLGDVYENPYPQNPVRRFFKSRIRKLSDAGIEVVILVGNHDACYFSHALEPVEGAGFPNVTVHYSPAFFEREDAAFLVVPHTQAVERRETTHKLLVQELAVAHAKDIAAAKAKGLSVVVLGHFGVNGAEMNDGATNKNKDDVSIDDLASIGADAIFLGHYHAHNSMDVSGAKAMYTGSLERSTFNDRKMPKGFVVTETDCGQKIRGSFVTYPRARQLIEVSGDADTIRAQVEQIVAAPTVEGVEPIVKVKFAGTTTEYAKFCKDKKAVRDMLGGVKHVAFERDIHDPDKDAAADAVRKQIAKKGEVGSTDILEIFAAYAASAQPDEDERKAIIGVASDIMAAVDERCRKAKGVMPGRTRIHGVKLHNFQLYGSEKNVVEFDRGAAKLFGRVGIDKKDIDWPSVNADAHAFIDSVDGDARQLISIVGKIEGDEGDSNGSGKSSILEAISWAFYEKIVRDFVDKESTKGSSIGTVVRTIDGKPERDCFVEVLFSAGNGLYVIRRERQFNQSGKHSGGVGLFCLYSPDEDGSGSMTGKHGEDAEQFINQLVSMDYDTFSNSVMFGQSDADRFIRGTDKAKKEIFIKVLGLTILDDYLKEIRARKSLLDKELVSLDAQSAALSSNAMTVEEEATAVANAESLKQQAAAESSKASASEETAKQLRGDPVFSEKASLSAEIDAVRAAIKRKLDEANKASASAVAAVAKAEEELARLRREHSASTSALSSAKSAESGMQADVSEFKEDQANKDVKYGNEAKKAKPGREAERDALAAKKEQVVAAVATLDGSMASANARLAKLRKSLGKLGDSQELPCPECENMVSRTHVEEKIKVAEAEVASLAAERAKASQPLAGIQAEIAEVNKRLANIEEYTEKGETASRKLAEHNGKKATLAVLKKRVEDAAVKQAACVDACSAAEKSLDGLRADAKRYADEAAAETASDVANAAALDRKMTDVVLPRQAAVEAQVEAAVAAAKAAMQAAGRLSADAAATMAKVEVSRQTAARVVKISAALAVKNVDMRRIEVVDAGFGRDGIRVQIIEKYLPLLNVHIDEFLEVVSGKMSMDVEADENGEIVLRIRGAAAGDPRQLSKGQFARVKVATDLALGMMSLARNENAPDFVCLDEVFAPVDVNGKKAMFDVITKLQEYFRMVLVISHDALVQETIKDMIVVNLVNDFSTIERQAYEH